MKKFINAVRTIAVVPALIVAGATGFSSVCNIVGACMHDTDWRKAVVPVIICGIASYVAEVCMKESVDNDV